MSIKRILFLLILCMGLYSSVNAQVRTAAEANKLVAGASMVRISEHTGNLDYVQLLPTAEVDLSKSEVWLRQVFRLGDESSWKLIGDEKDQLGNLHYRYQQAWNGVPIRDAIFILHTRNGKIFSVNGTLYPEISLLNQPTMSSNTAFNYAIAAVGAENYIWEFPEEEALLKRMTNNEQATYKPEGRLMLVSNKEGKGFYYSWCFDIYAKKPLSRQDVYVDAADGSLRLKLSTLYTHDVTGKAMTKYSGTQTITLDSVSASSYRLRETGRGNGIQTWDMNQSTNYGNAVDFTDTDTTWSIVNAQQDEVAGDAHWGTEVTYDYYMLEHGRNSIDDNGFALISYVHYDANFDNAFWDGQRMTYGDGSGSPYTAFTALDITGHEITHGLNTMTANLEYANESGALSEGFSDIFGTCIEFYGKPSMANWTCGENIGAVLRSLSNPSATGNPDTYLGTDWDPAQEVHQNSTVCSHWFYLLSQGGTGTNDNGDAYNVTGLGIHKASDIAYLTLTEFLTTNSDYADACFYAILAASQLYGGCSPEAIATTEAWFAVGLGSHYSPEIQINFSADYTSVCSAPITVQFTNTSLNVNTYLWRFGDGTTSTQINPTHTYSSTGNFDVELIGNGGTCGRDSLTQASFVSINTANSATVTLPASGIGTTQDCCLGTLYDNGGTGNYSNSSNSSITIAPTGASTVTLTFNSFDLESGFDYLYVYDGPNTSSTLIGQYDGTALPNGGIITSTSGSITLQQINDQGVVGTGFDLNWQCSVPNAAPITNFIADVKSTCIGVVQFTDASTNGPVSWLWNFGDGATSTQQHPIHAYTASGVYNVKLRCSNSFGLDSLVKNSYISVNLPAAPSTTPATTCDSTSTVLSATGVGQLDWYNAAVGGTLLGTGSNFTTPVLYTTTTFYVEDKNIHSPVYGGKFDTTGSGGNYSSTSNIHYLIFDCYTPLTLVSVKVYASGDGNRTIQLRDSALNVLQSLNVFIPDGESRVTLNFNVPVRNGLQLVCTSPMNLYRNNNGSATYPYTVSGKFSIIESSASQPPYNVNGNYYYFYDWEMQEPTCISARVPVQATVIDCIGNSVNENSSLSNIQLSPNPTSGSVEIQYPALSDGQLTLDLIDLTGRVLYSQLYTVHTGMNHFSLDLQNAASGVYVAKFATASATKALRLVKE